MGGTQSTAANPPPEPPKEYNVKRNVNVSPRANSVVTNVTPSTSNSARKNVAANSYKSPYKNVVINEQVKQKIQELDALIASFNKNDIKVMMTDIQKDGMYQDVLTPELTNKITTMHDKIVRQIGDQREIQTNAGLRNVIFKVVDQDIDQQLNQFVQDPMFADENLKKELGSIVNNIKSSHMKYKFFEYKYIQLNLFVLGFIKHVYQTMATFINANLETFEARERHRNELTLQFMTAVKKTLEGNDLTINDGDLAELSRLMDAMKRDIDEKGKELKTNLRDIASESVNSISGYVDKQKTEMISVAQTGNPVNAFVTPNLSTGAVINRGA